MFVTPGIAYNKLWKDLIITVITALEGFKTRGWRAIQGRTRQRRHLYQDRDLSDFEFCGHGCIILWLLLHGAAAAGGYPGYEA